MLITEKEIDENIARAELCESVEMPRELIMQILGYAKQAFNARRAYENYKRDYGVSGWNFYEAIETITNQLPDKEDLNIEKNQKEKGDGN